MAGNRHGATPTPVEKLREIADQAMAIAQKIEERTQVIEGKKVAQPAIESVKNAERAIGYLKGYSLALVACIDGLDTQEKSKARAKEALDAEAKANKRAKK